MTVTSQHPVRTMRFGPLQIAYDDQVLAPRAWTEWQATWAAEIADDLPEGPVLELCTGAGQIGLMTVALTGRDLVAVDLSVAACRFAKLNARAAGLAERVEVRNLPLESACAPDERFALVIADPPWVPAAQTGRYPEDPLSAIDGGPDGLDVARACLSVIEAHLAPRGAALLQVGDAAQVDLLEQRLPPRLELVETRTEAGRGAVALILGR